jgi:hypothetical protein
MSSVLGVTTSGTFVHGTLLSYTFGSTWGTDPFKEQHPTNGERLALRRHQVLTIPEFYERRFGRKTRVLGGALCVYLRHSGLGGQAGISTHISASSPGTASGCAAALKKK